MYYRVSILTTAFVEADDKEEAHELALDEYFMYSETEVTKIEEVDEVIIHL